MARRKGVTRFYRGARRHPKWDLGTPPGQRRGRPGKRARRRRVWPALLGGAMFLILFGPNILDAGSLLWRDSKGCTVWMVVDGDTVRMHCPVQGFVSGRLVGFDTPEMNARCPRELGMAVAATYYLRWQLWTAREVVATPRDRDRYDRVLTLMGFDGDLASTRMIRSGLARPYDGGQRRSWCDA